MNAVLAAASGAGLALAIELAILQAGAWLLARCLALRLGKGIALVSVLGPLILLAPWLARDVVLAPTGALSAMIPGAAPAAGPDPHAGLNDAVTQFLPWERELRRLWSEGEPGFWSDRLDGGSSPWANPQAGVLSPIHLAARAFPIDRFLLAAMAAKLSLATSGAWILAAALGLRRRGRSIAAASVALGGAIVPWGLFPHSAVAALAPWLAAAAIRTARGRSRSSRGLAIATSATILSGHPEVALVSLAFAAILGFSYLRRPLRSRGLLRLGGGVAIGIAISGLMLLPSAIAIASSTRFAAPSASSAFVGSGSILPSPFRDYLRVPFHPEPFGTPYAGGALPEGASWPDATCGYAGLVAIAGAALAIANGRRRAMPLLAFALLAFVLSSRFAWISPSLARVPGFGGVVWSRALPIASIALALAGAIGWESQLRAKSARGLGTAAAIGLVFATGWIAGGRPPEREWIVLAVVALAAIGAATPAGLRRRAGLVAAALVLAAGVDLVPWALAQLPRGRAAAFFEETKLVEALRARPGPGAGPGRVAAVDGLAQASVLAYYGFAELRPQNPLVPRGQARFLETAFGWLPLEREYFSGLRRLPASSLERMGVEWILAREGDGLPPGWKPIASPSDAPIAIFENRAAVPLVFLPDRVDLIPEAGLSALIESRERARAVTIVRDTPEESGTGARGIEACGPGADLRILAWRSGRVRAAVRTERPCLLATSLPVPDGWSARDEKGRLPSLTVDGAFFGAIVPGGTTEIELRFVPPGLAPGLALSAIGWVFFLRAGRRQAVVV